MFVIVTEIKLYLNWVSINPILRYSYVTMIWPESNGSSLISHLIVIKLSKNLQNTFYT